MVYIQDYRSSRGGINRGIEVTLTPEQESRPEESKSSVIWNVGYISPEQVEHYVCEKCGVVEDVPIKVLADVSKRSHVSATIMYSCGKCDEPVIFGTVPEELIPTIPSEVIDFDPTGNYVTPTPESIEKLLVKVEEEAAEGPKMEFRSDGIKVLETWAAMIGYELPEDRMRALPETCRTAYIERMIPEFPRLVDDLLERELDFNLDERSGFSGWEHIYDRVTEFFELLPHIPVPDDMGLCARIKRVLDLRTKMYETRQGELKEQAEELRQQAEALEAKRNNAEGAGFHWLDKVPGLKTYLESQQETPVHPMARDISNPAEDETLKPDDSDDPPF